MDYTNNGKSERRKEKPVVKRDRVQSSKESLGKKMIKAFFADDIQDIKSYLLWDKIVPGVKNLILDGLEKMFFKEVRRRRDGRSGYDYSNSSYRYYYDGKSNDRNSGTSRPKETQDKVDCRNVVLTYREDAENLIRRMKQLIREDGEITVAQMFDLIESPSDYIDNNWGWTDERDIGMRRISNGYLIDVREPKYLGGR